jgi:hypothetical protein
LLFEKTPIGDPVGVFLRPRVLAMPAIAGFLKGISCLLCIHWNNYALANWPVYAV